MRGRLAALGLGAVLATGCFVDVSHVTDPEPAFRKARAEAESLAGRKGPARSVQVLVYDPDERELVRVSVPMWIARRIEKESNWETSLEADSEDGAERALHALRGRVSFKDLERSALGTLIEVEDASGEQVMVWLK
jgi:hypothetical protein